MKTFLITITIIGALIYGMLQLNEHYDDKGACGWSLFHGGYYYHKERVDKAIEGLMNDIIKHDKKARKALMIKQGKSQADINQTLKSLEPQYQKEKEKMQKYCYLDFDKKPYFQKKSMEVKPSDYCVIGTGNNVRDEGYGGFDLKYNFDKESFKFFNQVPYYTTRKDKLYYLTDFYGIEYDTPYFPCETRYQGLGESGGFLMGSVDGAINIDKTKYIRFYEWNRKNK